MAKPVLSKSHLVTWGVYDQQNQTDHTAKPSLQPWHFLIWSSAEIMRYFGIS